MKLARCPHCGHDLDLETIVDDSAGRELMGLLSSLDGNLGNAMVKYLALFRPAKRGSTPFDKLLRLSKEVLEQFPDHPRLTVALSTTREGIMSKRTATEEWKPLKNHNYLKQVYESTPTPAPVLAADFKLAPEVAQQPQTSMDTAQQILQGMMDTPINFEEDWFRHVILEGVIELVKLALPRTPAAKNIGESAAAWVRTIWKHPEEWNEELDKERIQEAFGRLARKADKFPAPKGLIDEMAFRPAHVPGGEMKVLTPEEKERADAGHQQFLAAIKDLNFSPDQSGRKGGTDLGELTAYEAKKNAENAGAQA